MYIEKTQLDNIPTYDIIKDNVIFTITFAGNLDLYWEFRYKDRKASASDVITMEISEDDNYYIYHALDKLYDSISGSYVLNYKGESRTMDEQAKQSSHYHELYRDGAINWISDDRDCRIIGDVTIIKNDKTFELTLRKEKFAKGFFSGYKAPIRFRNSGSYYHPFNMVFMDMYNELNKIEDLNQITIDQYCKRKVKTR